MCTFYMRDFRVRLTRADAIYEVMPVNHDKIQVMEIQGMKVAVVTGQCGYI